MTVSQRILPLKPLKFGSISTPNPNDYAQKVYPSDSTTPSKTDIYIPNEAPNKPFISWRHPNRSVVHALTVFLNKKGQPIIRLLLQNRKAMGGFDTVEAPAGKYGDTDPTETAEQGARREVSEETGLVFKKIMMLSEDGDASREGASIATSPGITNERKAFALVLAQDAKTSELALTESEKQQNVRQLDIPLKTLLDPKRFQKWRAEMQQSQKVVGVDILALRGLLPDQKTLFNFLGLKH